jgi:lipoprotein-releasing system ATP-binding protein
MSEAVLSCRGLRKVFREGSAQVEVLRSVDLDVARGERVAIVGVSGSGKSTLLHLLGGLDVPSAGSVHLAGRDLSRVADAERGRLRNQALGFIYQFHHLLPEFSALENVAMPLFIRRIERSEAEGRARRMLEAVGLGHRLDHAPGELSGGERQRAAIARALVTEPACVLADEPTGNLDRATGEEVVAALERLHDDGITLIIVTHDPDLGRRAHRRLRMADGRIVGDEGRGRG